MFWLLTHLAPFDETSVNKERRKVGSGHVPRAVFDPLHLEGRERAGNVVVLAADGRWLHAGGQRRVPSDHFVLVVPSHLVANRVRNCQARARTWVGMELLRENRTPKAPISLASCTTAQESGPLATKSPRKTIWSPGW